jgi:fumarate reductase subunit D
MATSKLQKGKPVTQAPIVQAKTKSIPTVSNLPFLFAKENYLIMVAGIVVVIIGFLLMLGVANDNPAVFPKEEIYSFRRISLAPVVVLIGFVIEIYAILKRPKTA